ncbi:hypothetical protein D3C80_626610 [compost metagenome]
MEDPHGWALDGDEMCRPHLSLLRGSGAPGGNQRPCLRQVFGDHKELGKGGMGPIGFRCGQHYFGVGGEFDIAAVAATVGQRDTPYLAIPLTRHQHLHGGGQTAVPMEEVGAILGKHDLLLVGGAPQGLRARRPGLATLHIVQEQEVAQVVTGAVRLPTGDGDVAPTAVARPRTGEHDRVTAIGEQVSHRGAVHRGQQPPYRADVLAALGLGCLYLGATRPDDGHVLRYPLL